jgi:hypothetical protein
VIRKTNNEQHPGRCTWFVLCSQYVLLQKSGTDRVYGRVAGFENGSGRIWSTMCRYRHESETMTLTLTHAAAAAAGLALFVTWFAVSPKGLLKGLVPAVALAVAAALLITVARSLG